MRTCTKSHHRGTPDQAGCGGHTQAERNDKSSGYVKHHFVHSIIDSPLPDSVISQNHMSTVYMTCNACSRSPFLVGNTLKNNIYMVLCRRPTLIFGEPGLEKDNIAAQIHYRSSKHQEWPIARFDCSKLDSYGSQLFGRGSKQGLLHWVGEGTLLLTNVHKVSLTCCLALQTSALAVANACTCCLYRAQLLQYQIHAYVPT